VGIEPTNTGFADLQGAFVLACPRFVPIVYSTDYRFHFQRIQAHLNRHPLHYPLQCKRAHVRQMRFSEIRSCRKPDLSGTSARPVNIRSYRVLIHSRAESRAFNEPNALYATLEIKIDRQEQYFDNRFCIFDRNHCGAEDGIRKDGASEDSLRSPYQRLLSSIDAPGGDQSISASDRYPRSRLRERGISRIAHLPRSKGLALRQWTRPLESRTIRVQLNRREPE
jgi:hypothetical protein